MLKKNEKAFKKLLGIDGRAWYFKDENGNHVIVSEHFAVTVDRDIVEEGFADDLVVSETGEGFRKTIKNLTEKAINGGLLAGYVGKAHQNSEALDLSKVPGEFVRFCKKLKASPTAMPIGKAWVDAKLLKTVLGCFPDALVYVSDAVTPLYIRDDNWKVTAILMPTRASGNAVKPWEMYLQSVNKTGEVEHEDQMCGT